MRTPLTDWRKWRDTRENKNSARQRCVDNGLILIEARIAHHHVSSRDGGCQDCIIARPDSFMFSMSFMSICRSCVIYEAWGELECLMAKP